MARSEQAQPHLSLDDYRVRHNIPPWAFNGVENPDENIRGCDHIYTQWERNELAQSLDDAEGDLADVLGYYLGARYLIDYDRPWNNPLKLKYGYVLGGGIRARDEVTPSASDFTIDPATITVPAASFSGGTSEVVVIEDETGLEIEADGIATVGANYIISISQYKLLNWTVLEDQSDPISYNAAFPAASWLKLADLTVYRQYRDETTQATITYGPSCACWCTAGTACAGTDYTGCVFVLNREIGLVRANRATLSSGVWSCDTTAVCGCYAGDKVTVYYQAGEDDIPGWERAVWRLAHSQMGDQPCGCSLMERQWRKDSFTPTVLTAERLNCPFGLTNGAWAAWRWARRHQHGEGFML
jgi:hypothetical protein